MGRPAEVRELLTAEQRSRLVAAVRAGKKWADVADECGYSSAANAAKAFRNLLKSERDALSEAVLTLREVEGERLDGIYQAALQALQGCTTAGEVNQCLTTMLRTVESRARLFALNEEPVQKVEVAFTGLDSV